MRTLLCLLVVSTLTACGGGGSSGQGLVPGPGEPPVNLAPTLAIAPFDTPPVTCLGGVFELSYTDDDPEDEALTWFFADMDGDWNTTYDQWTLAGPLPETDGAPRTIRVGVKDLPPGLYHLLGMTWDRVNDAVITPAADALEVRDVSHRDPIAATVAFPEFSVAMFPDGGAASTIGTNSVFFRTPSGGASGGVFGIGNNVADLTVTADGALVAAGSANGVVTLPPLPGAAPLGAQDALIVKFRSDLRQEPEWVLLLAGQAGDSAAVRAVAEHPSGDLVVAGTYTGELTFDRGGPAETTLTSSGAADLFVARLTAAGGFVWARSFGASAPGIGGNEELVVDIAATAAGDVMIAGVMESTPTNPLVFDAGGANEASALGFGFYRAVYAADGTFSGVTTDQETSNLGLRPDPVGGLAADPLGGFVYAIQGTVRRYAPDGTETFSTGVPEAVGAPALLADGSLVIGSLQADGACVQRIGAQGQRLGTQHVSAITVIARVASGARDGSYLVAVNADSGRRNLR